MDNQDNKVALVGKVIQDRKVRLVNLEILAVLVYKVSVSSLTYVLSLLPERDYVTFGSLLSQIHLSVCRLSVCNIGAPYSGG